MTLNRDQGADSYNSNLELNEAFKAGWGAALKWWCDQVLEARAKSKEEERRVKLMLERNVTYGKDTAVCGLKELNGVNPYTGCGGKLEKRDTATPYNSYDEDTNARINLNKMTKGKVDMTSGLEAIRQTTAEMNEKSYIIDRDTINFKLHPDIINKFPPKADRED